MTVRQHSFYLDDEDWKSLRHYCLDHGMSVSSFVAKAARDAIGDPRPVPVVPLVPVAGKAGEPHRYIPETVVQTGTGAPAAIPYNPVRAVPKPAPRKSSKARVKA